MNDLSKTPKIQFETIMFLLPDEWEFVAQMIPDNDGQRAWLINRKLPGYAHSVSDPSNLMLWFTPNGIIENTTKRHWGISCKDDAFYFHPDYLKDWVYKFPKMINDSLGFDFEDHEKLKEWYEKHIASNNNPLQYCEINCLINELFGQYTEDYQPEAIWELLDKSDDRTLEQCKVMALLKISKHLERIENLGSNFCIKTHDK